MVGERVVCVCVCVCVCVNRTISAGDTALLTILYHLLIQLPFLCRILHNIGEAIAASCPYSNLEPNLRKIHCIYNFRTNHTVGKVIPLLETSHLVEKSPMNTYMLWYHEKQDSLGLRTWVYIGRY